MTPEILRRLMAGRMVSDIHPWSSGKVRKVDNWYKTTCASVASSMKLEIQVEFRMGGMGYASFIDAWICDPASKKQPLSSDDQGLGGRQLLVMLCRLAPLFYFSEGEKRSSTRIYGDDVSSGSPLALAKRLQPVLEGYGLKRVSPKDLATPLPDGVMSPIAFNRRPYTEFDAYFRWYD